MRCVNCKDDAWIPKQRVYVLSCKGLGLDMRHDKKYRCFLEKLSFSLRFAREFMNW